MRLTPRAVLVIKRIIIIIYTATTQHSAGMSAGSLTNVKH